MEQRTKEWYDARKGLITGSSIGAILGLSPFSKKEDVMRRMVREYHGAESEFKGNIATEYGVNNEPNALADYAMMHNKVEECGFYVHHIFTWLGASPDGLVGEDKLIEIKCPYGLRNAKSDDDFKPLLEQMHYYAQIQYQLFCTNRKECDFYQWSAYASRLETVAFDPDFIEKTLPELKEFYDNYLSERSPANAWKYLDGGKLVENYKKAKANLDVAKDNLEDAKQLLISATDGKGGKIGDLNITLAKRQGSIAYAKAVKDLLPDANLDSYRGKETEYWVIK